MSGWNQQCSKSQLHLDLDLSVLHRSLLDPEVQIGSLVLVFLKCSPQFAHFCAPGIHKSVTKKGILVEKFNQFSAKITFASQKCTETNTTEFFVAKFGTK